MATRTKTTAIPSAGEAWELAENATMRLPRGGSAAIVRVERGTMLLTQEGDLEDHVLEPGDEMVLKAGPLAVAWAFTEAAISVCEGVVGRLQDPPSALLSAGRSRKLFRWLLGGWSRAPHEDQANDDGLDTSDSVVAACLGQR